MENETGNFIVLKFFFILNFYNYFITKNGNISNSYQGEETHSNTLDDNLLILVALKSMSNLIYNSKYIQNYYAHNQLAENISLYLKSLTIPTQNYTQAILSQI